MSTRTDWGLFRQDGSRLVPVAVGDEHWKWVCPKRTWQRPAPDLHPITGELIEQDLYLPQCPFISAGDKRDKCFRCEVVFIYP